MISDAYVDVCCDTCYQEKRIELEWKYSDYSGNNGFYDADDSSIEKTLQEEFPDWICEGEQHFCDEKCQNDGDVGEIV